MPRNNGVKKTSVRKQKTAATRLANWVWAPAAMATEVLDRLPTTRKPPKRPLRILAGPCAISSWFGSMSPPPCIAAAFAAAERFGIADQHDGERAGRELPQYREVELGQCEVRQTGRQLADDADTGGFTAEQADQDRGHDCDDQRRWYARRQMAQQQHRYQAEQAGQHRGERDVRQMLNNKPEFGEEIAGCALDTQQMWHLTDYGDADEALDKSSHNRCRDEGSHPAHAQCAEQQKKGTDQALPGWR